MKKSAVLLILVLFFAGCAVPKKPPMPSNGPGEMTYLMTTTLSDPRVIATPTKVAIPTTTKSWNIYESKTLNLISSDVSDPVAALGGSVNYRDNRVTNVWCTGDLGNELVDAETGQHIPLAATYSVNGETASTYATTAYKSGSYIYATRMVTVDGSRHLALQKFDLSGRMLSTLKSIHLPEPTTAGLILTTFLGGTTRAKGGLASVICDDTGNIYWSVVTWWSDHSSPNTYELYLFDNHDNLLTQMEYDGKEGFGYYEMSRYHDGAVIPDTHEFINLKTLMRKPLDYPDNFIKASMHHLFYLDNDGKIYYTDKDYD